jgi:molecular chaperone HscC
VDDDGIVLVGLPARERLLSHPRQSAASFKRYMGSNRSCQLGARSFRAEELSALVLQALKADAEAFLGQSISEAIITVPAYFNDAQRKATKAAGEMAGLKVERLLNEPTAAALLASAVHGAAARTSVLPIGIHCVGPTVPVAFNLADRTQPETSFPVPGFRYITEDQPSLVSA